MRLVQISRNRSKRSLQFLFFPFSVQGKFLDIWTNFILALVCVQSTSTVNVFCRTEKCSASTGNSGEYHTTRTLRQLSVVVVNSQRCSHWSGVGTGTSTYCFLLLQFPCNGSGIGPLQCKQECIPVGCVPPAYWPYPSMHCAEGVSAQGVSTPLWISWQTCVKTLPCCNSGAGGNKSRHR